MIQALCGREELPDDWERTAEMVRETTTKVSCVSSGFLKERQKTGWWNVEGKENIQRNAKK